MKNLDLKNETPTFGNTVLYTVLKRVTSPVFRFFYIVSWVALILTFMAAIPIYVLAFIFFNERSDMFSHIIYDRWFGPLQRSLLNGI